tara:strand:- start:28848 stop:29138 length:291 start_codon:yes stop_codon:yes gene_type:complete
MYRIFFVTCIAFSVTAPTAFAVDEVKCDHYYEMAERKEATILVFGPDLAQPAKDYLYQDLLVDTSQCISHCGAEKLAYCNEVAEQIERGNLTGAKK